VTPFGLSLSKRKFNATTIFNPDSPLGFEVSQNQGVVGRDLSRQVGLALHSHSTKPQAASRWLKPDLRSNGLFGFKAGKGAFHAPYNISLLI
jgi:hypothetical protein